MKVPAAALDSEEELGGGRRGIDLDMGTKAVLGGETDSSDIFCGSIKYSSSSSTTSLVLSDMSSAIKDDIGFNLNGEAI